MDRISVLKGDDILQPSLGPDISDAILEQLLSTKDIIDKRKQENKVVALVHLSGDLMHSSQIQYMNIIKAKIHQRLGVPYDDIKLVVGVEADTRTFIRKQKANINSELERVYNFSNLKAVDHAYVEFEGVISPMENEERPAGIVKYLAPTVLITHQEHTSELPDYLGMFRRFRESNPDGTVLCINFKDSEKYLGEAENRDVFDRSTTKTIQTIFNSYRGNPKYDQQT